MESDRSAGLADGVGRTRAAGSAPQTNLPISSVIPEIVRLQAAPTVSARLQAAPTVLAKADDGLSELGGEAPYLTCFSPQ